jgi:hypothetical protein
MRLCERSEAISLARNRYQEIAASLRSFRPCGSRNDQESLMKQATFNLQCIILLDMKI